MKILGLTGPTGAGKGEVARRLAKAGALIVDTDRIAREVVEKGQPCLAALAEAFGENILQADGSLDRAALAAAAFSSPEGSALLSRITHPFIIARSLEILNHSTADRAVIDAPLMFESGMDAYSDTTVAVLAPAEERLRRIMARDGIAEDRAVLRMNAQPAEAFYRERAAYTIENDRDEQALDEAVQALVGAVWEET